MNDKELHLYVSHLIPLMIDLGYKDIKIKDWRIVASEVARTLHQLCSGIEFSYNREEESDGS